LAVTGKETPLVNVIRRIILTNNYKIKEMSKVKQRHTVVPNRHRRNQSDTNSGWCPARWRLPVIGTFLSFFVLLTGCSTVDFNYKRFAYDLLRQDDCRRNDIDPFCARTFVFEFDDYERLRKEYIRQESTDSAPQRVSHPTTPDRGPTFLPARNNY